MALDHEPPGDAIRAHAPEGVQRVIELALSDKADLDAAVTALGNVIAASATRSRRPALPMLFTTLTIRLLGSDDFASGAECRAADDLATTARERFLPMVP